MQNRRNFIKNLVKREVNIMSDCTHDCSSCGESCAQRESKPEDFLVKLSKGSSVKKVIGVVSGKGGVGKSMVTSLLAAASMREGFKTAILDGDITKIIEDVLIATAK